MSEGTNRWSELNLTSGSEYAAHFQQLADSGQDVHGEATFVEALVQPGARVLDAGCGTGRVAVRLSELGYACVGVDSDASMLDQARQANPDGEWVLFDLSSVTPEIPALRDPFDVIIAAGNVIPLLGEGVEASAIRAMAGLLAPGGLLVVGFGLDVAHLPIDFVPVDLPSYDQWCIDAGLEPVDRWSTWDREPFDDGGYAVSLHRRP